MSELPSSEQESEEVATPESFLSLSKGLNFYFDTEGSQVYLWASAFSGKEQVYVNDTLVSSGRSWRKSNRHNFTINGTPYSVVTGVRSWKDLLIGSYFAELYRENRLIDKDQLFIAGCGKDGKSFSWKRFMIDLIPWFVVGGLVGYLVGFFSN